MENKELRKLMQDTFDSFEPEPSRDLWAEIENAIEPKRKKVFLWPYLVAAAAAILLFIALGFWLTDPKRGMETPSVVMEEKLQPEKSAVPAERFVPEVPQPREVVENATPKNLPQKESSVATLSPAQSASPQQKKAPEPEQENPEPPVMGEAIAVETPKKNLDLPVPAVLGDQPGINLSEKELALVVAPAPLTVKRPVKPEVRSEKHEIDLNGIAGRSLATFANGRLDKLQMTSPVEVVEKEFTNGSHKSVKVGFKPFNITHKRHKQYTIKKPDA